MAILKTYSTWEEKEKILSNRIIDTKDQFDELYNLLKTQPAGVWRGVCEAKHKNFTSLQRFWLEYELSNSGQSVENYLKHAFEFCENWHGGAVSRLFKEGFEKEFTAYAKLSMLRHYGAPVPFLDCTRDPLIALYFGAADAQTVAGEGLANYFSVYHFKPHHWTQGGDAKRVLVKSTRAMLDSDKNLAASIFEFMGKEDATEVDIARVLSAHSEMFLGMIETLDTGFLIEDRHDDEIIWGLKTNMNIINQQGVFVMNNSAEVPIEELSFDMLERDKMEIVITEEMTNMAKSNARESQVCYNIRKSLKHYILAKLRIDGITKDFLFPDLYKMADELKMTFLERL